MREWESDRGRSRVDCGSGGLREQAGGRQTSMMRELFGVGLIDVGWTRNDLGHGSGVSSTRLAQRRDVT